MDSLDDINIEEDEDEEEITSPSQVLDKLEETWYNEKFAPDLLPYEGELVECMLDQIKHMEDNLSRLKHGDFRLTVHKMELDRIQYVLTSYLRLRLSKVERFGAHLLEQESRGTGDSSILSSEERQFAKHFVEITENYLHESAIQNLPANMQSFTLASTASKPKLDSYVFLKVKKSVGGLLIEEETADNREEIVDFEKDSQHLVRYKPIAPLLAKGCVALI